MPRKRSSPRLDEASRNFSAATDALLRHPLFAPLLNRAHVIRAAGNACPEDGWVAVTQHGDLHVHPTRRADSDEWTYVIAHALLHLGLNHFQQQHRQDEWNAACDVFVTRFLADLKIGRPPEQLREPDLLGGTEERLYNQFCTDEIPKHLRNLGTAGPKYLDMIHESTGQQRWRNSVNWPALLAYGLKQAVAGAIEVAAGHAQSLSLSSGSKSPAQKARSWFISSYPLLGAMVAGFDLVEDTSVCTRESISVAAVNAFTKEIFINSVLGLSEEECRFVIAHEVLHVGLMHAARCQGRDPYLWNIACDFVVNGWLVEMGVGSIPRFGALHDPELKGLSAESVYDRIVTDLRRYRKLGTFRGVGLGEMLGERDWHLSSDAQDLDDFYKRALTQGLEYHQASGRGYLPAGLIEEIRALSQAPIPWDVQLANWFDDYFDPLEKRRSYARPSRRQAATPDIPRPRHVPFEAALDGRTFGVILDTSGSMDRVLLAKALGAIASYSMARDVPAVRVVFCDAATYDQGYMAPEAIAGRVQVRGRGGTVLQPGIDLLQRAEDFPTDGPLLVITDGFCDSLQIRRNHAFVIPRGRHLPFAPAGPVFRMD